MMDVDLARWQAPPPPERVTLSGALVDLVPLDAARHGASLWREVATSPDLWEFMTYGPFADEAAFTTFLAARACERDPLFFAILDRAKGEALGWLALMEIRPSHGVVEIGNILFGPRLQKTRAATEAIFLAAAHVFALGYRRLEWKCNAVNLRSRRAALRYGFTEEGVFRQHMVVKGRNRDTAWFALLDCDWPARHAAFSAWLDARNFDAQGRQLRALHRGTDA